MGNSSSSEQQKRPVLKASASSSSTTTLKASHSQKRRKSIELPDLQNAPSHLALTPTTSPLDLKGKGKALPPTSTQVYHDSTVANEEIFLGSHISDIRGTPAQPIALPENMSIEGQLSLSSQDASLTDDQIRKHLSQAKDKTIRPTPSTLSQQEIPLPFDYGSVASTLVNMPLGADLSKALPPLNPPIDTVLAPFIPEAVPLPLGTGASATTGLIVGSPLSSETSTPVVTPSQSDAKLQVDKINLSAEGTSAEKPLPKEVVALSEVSSETTQTHQQLPLPAAAPLVALTGSFQNDPAAVEAVKAATVDLGAGPEGVPTLLTWTPGEGAGKEGGVAEGEHGPQRVYVTGTFAKDWTTKIEMRKKKWVSFRLSLEIDRRFLHRSQPDFTALVNLPPGPHRLKFIVDTQWKTSKNLPSATDQYGSLFYVTAVFANKELCEQAT